MFVWKELRAECGVWLWTEPIGCVAVVSEVHVCSKTNYLIQPESIACALWFYGSQLCFVERIHRLDTNFAIPSPHLRRFLFIFALWIFASFYHSLKIEVVIYWLYVPIRTGKKTHTHARARLMSDGDLLNNNNLATPTLKSGRSVVWSLYVSVGAELIAILFD